MTVFFTDRDLGKRFPQILTEAGLKVERHDEHFAPICSDEVWLEEIGRRGWVAITHDTRIRYKPNELAAVLEHRVKLLVVVGRAPIAELARSFIATKERILDFVSRHDAPFVAKVYRASTTSADQSVGTPGRIEMSYPRL